jgi:hypothetical protein
MILVMKILNEFDGPKRKSDLPPMTFESTNWRSVTDYADLLNDRFLSIM